MLACPFLFLFLFYATLLPFRLLHLAIFFLLSFSFSDCRQVNWIKLTVCSISALNYRIITTTAFWSRVRPPTFFLKKPSSSEIWVGTTERKKFLKAFFEGHQPALPFFLHFFLRVSAWVGMRWCQTKKIARILKKNSWTKGNQGRRERRGKKE